ncbi:MAG TPA: SpoIIE family protein phosphatase [Actinoplanes sp.]|nr:SpoIIE family protein phosphatase [Actinoplanes sp.]
MPDPLDRRRRLDSLIRTGLGAEPDPMFDRFASIVQRTLGVPVALVSLVDDVRQVFPGACGLAVPWQQQRQTPLSHSFCQHVVTSAEPLVIEDARTDPLVAANLAITDLGVIGYAGIPLTDADGLVLGSLCAIDTSPRRWTAAELDLLTDLAAACSESLRLRITTRITLDHSQMLLRASVALANTSTPADVIDAVRSLVGSTLGPAYVGVSLLGADRQVDLQSGSLLPARVADRWRRYPQASLTPSALAAHTGLPVLLPDPAAITARTPDAAATFTEMGWQSGASVPLPGPDGPIGALTFVWTDPNPLDAAAQTTIAALAGYVGQALRRTGHLISREQVATLLQQSMLTELPDAAPFELAARYSPASRGEHVGGDWYDAVRRPDGHLALVVGDVAGHDMLAAARMGQLRSMLRAFVVDRHEPPSALLHRLDTAMQVLGDPVPTTALLAYVSPEGTGHRLQWANAGHPSPVLLEADGTVTALTGRDVLLGVRRRSPRTDWARPLPPGSTVLFYTDGLIETRTDVIDDRKQRLHRILAKLSGAPLPDLLDELLHRLAGDSHEDDVAMLALRHPA